MGVGKNIAGHCPCCGNDVAPISEQRDERYTVCQCNACGSHSARKSNGVTYPLVDPSDPNSGWVVYNPTI